MDKTLIINLVYVVAAVLFVFGLKELSSPATARRGNLLSAAGMLIAVAVTLLDRGILDFKWLAVGIIAGSIIGALAARYVAMTSMPEMVALFNGSGGLASALVGFATLFTTGNTTFTIITVILSIFIGNITFTGSLIAYGKLSEKISGKPVLFSGQQILNSILVLAVIVCGILFILEPTNPIYLYVIIGVSLLLGIMVVIPIGGADMPVVISLLNSYSGLAACAAGFAVNNIILIVAGALVGASGIILTNIMCKAMNRSLSNVLFSGFGAVKQQTGKAQGEVNPINAEDAYYILEAASSVLIVPGYGLAVAQAQHVVKELQHLLEKNGAEVFYAVHPVAGRMPGHMNVLLAEADISYDLLLEMEQANPRMEHFDVAMVIGANDVVNPDARDNETSPIYGMPIINVDHAQTVFVLKRSMASGFAGIENPLFFKPNTRMLFGDAKDSISAVIREFSN